jgi:mRNA interferase MazF
MRATSCWRVSKSPNWPERKSRTAVVLFKEYENIVVAGITSNLEKDGLARSRKDGALKDSIIKTNCFMTLASPMIIKKLFELSKAKKRETG